MIMMFWGRFTMGIAISNSIVVRSLWVPVVLSFYFMNMAFADGAGTSLAPVEGSLHSNVDCWQHLVDYHDAPVADKMALLDREIEMYQVHVEKSLAYRAQSIAVARRLKRKIRDEQPLSGKDLDILNQGTVAHLALRDDLYDSANTHECWIEATDETLAHYGVDENIRVKGIMLSLSSAFLLYDNYLFAITVFEEDKKLRRFLNTRDSGYDIGRDELANVTLAYNSLRNRARLKSALEFYQQLLKDMNPEFLKDESAAYLQLMIQQSPTYQMTQDSSPLRFLRRKVKFFGAVTSDGLNELSNEGLSLFSMVFGNTMGLVETRKGKLYKKKTVKKILTQTLQAGDILLEKTPFRLTDKFIPGHWGHAAVWIGSETEIRELGIWENPVVRKYHKDIRRGQRVVEALRTGVELNPLDKFMNIDDLAVLRANHQKKEARAAYVIQALRQVGKSYDFNFDVETTDRIVCSELIYVVYTDIEWPTKNTLGRATISPDHVAEKALDSGPLELVALYHDGNHVRNDPLKKLQQLMRPELDSPAYMSSSTIGRLLHLAR